MMRLFREAVLLPVLWLCLLATALPAAAGQSAPQGGPRPALQEPAPDGTPRLSDGDRCPLCGMFPAKRPRSAAGMRLTDGRTFYFCGNGCLLRAWKQPETYLGVPAGNIAAMTVMNYLDGKPMDARKALWVAGSDVIGPMGPALVVLRDQAEVEAFKARHGGRLVFRLSEMNDQLWLSLFPKKQQ